MKKMMVVALVAFFLSLAAIVEGPRVHAQTTPVPPSNLTLIGGVLRWTDAGSEDGYEVTATISGRIEETREFQLARDVTEFPLPAEFQPRCPDRYGASYSVRAVYGAALSEPAMAGIALQCPIENSGGSTSNAPGLPITGAGVGDRHATGSWLVDLTLAIVGVAAMGSGLFLRRGPKGWHGAR
jgi:hypothetical protein